MSKKNGEVESDIDTLFGIALGCLGMSADDFDRCTPFEFSKIIQQWERQKEESEKRSWEQTRFMATCCLQPYSKKALKPTDVAQFPWDKDAGPKVEKGHGSIERMKELEARLKKERNEMII